MNTTDNNSNKHSLQELKQRKRALELKRIKWNRTLIAILSVLVAVVLFSDLFLTGDVKTRFGGVLSIIYIPFLGYVAVKATKWNWAVNDVDREIKKIEEQQTDIPNKKKPASGFFSTPHHTWDEKLAKVFGVIAILMIFLSLATINFLGGIDLIHYDFPRLFKANYYLTMMTALCLGWCSIRYRSDLSLMSRICLWSAVILFLACLPLLYMEYKIGGWILFLAFILSVIDMFRFEKEVYFLKLDDTDN